MHPFEALQPGCRWFNAVDEPLKLTSPDAVRQSLLDESTLRGLCVSNYNILKVAVLRSPSTQLLGGSMSSASESFATSYRRLHDSWLGKWGGRSPQFTISHITSNESSFPGFTYMFPVEDRKIINEQIKPSPF